MAKARLTPVYPGVYLKELLEELKLSQYRLAQDIGTPAMRISHVVRGKRPVTAELALRLGRYFGQSSRYWLNLQSRYDVDVAEDALGDRVAREVRPLSVGKARSLRPQDHRSRKASSSSGVSRSSNVVESALWKAELNPCLQLLLLMYLIDWLNPFRHLGKGERSYVIPTITHLRPNRWKFGAKPASPAK